jgi:two-component system sensor histidine kinase PhoQ
MLSSLYLRLNVGAFILLTLLISATGFIMEKSFKDTSLLNLRERMSTQLNQLINMASIDGKGNVVMPLNELLPLPQLKKPYGGIYAFVVKNNTHREVWRSPSLIRQPIPKVINLKKDEKRWQEVRMESGMPYYLLAISQSYLLKGKVYAYDFFLLTKLTISQNQFKNFRQKLWSGLAIVAVFLLAAQIILLWWGLKPLRQVRRELRIFETGHAEEISGQYPREINILTRKINHLLKSERTRQQRYRHALADLSHSLNTPLAVLTVALDEPETLSEVVKEQVKKMQRIVERQLQRAGNVGHNSGALLQPVCDNIERLLTSLDKVYRTKNIIVSNTVDRAQKLRCDEADLIELLGNILDNAYKWSTNKIDISGIKVGELYLITIRDDGPGIDPDIIEKILQRGGRADQNVSGNGFGLSLVAELVEAYNGKLTIESNIDGGAQITLALPA